MCGIAGIVALQGRPPVRAELVSMCDTLLHRGPDGDGYLLEGPVGLGMRRLSIIDLEGGGQPIWNEDGNVAVVFNGEIYNFHELRRRLEAQGHRFRTASDTEVIVHLWEEEGADFARHLDGMFAIALYDRPGRRVALARDHLGVKPLYYWLDPDGLVFGSEIKALLASGRLSARLDVDSLAQFLAWEYVPGAATLLAGVRRLEPAHVLELDLETGRTIVQRFWHPLEAAAETRARSTADWVETVDETVRRCVRRQLVSDVPLGALLSGGVDSSLVVASMGAAETFSIGFDDPTYDETHWSRRVADHLGVRHHVEIIRPDALALFDGLMQIMDDPIGDFSIFATYLVSRMARRHVKVVLSGDGGDELFGGYETYRAEERWRDWARLPSWLRQRVIEPAVHVWPPAEAKKGPINKVKRFVEGARLDPALGHARWRLFCDEAMRARVLAPGALRRVESPVGAHIIRLRTEAAEHGRDSRDQALYVDLASYLVDNCLAKVDRMSMACSLEARVPLLDRELVELAFQLPSRHKFNGHEGKILLKRVAERHVPRDCVRRPKEGFSIPMKRWLRAEFRELAAHYLAPHRIGAEGLFDSATVGRLWREHLDKRANHSHLLWSLLVFEHWRERWGVST